MIHQDSDITLRTKHLNAVMEPIATGDQGMRTAIARAHRVRYSPAWMGEQSLPRGVVQSAIQKEHQVRQNVSMFCWFETFPFILIYHISSD